MEFRERELAQGGVPIWPATPRVQGEMKTDKLAEEEEFCSQLQAEACSARAELVW